MKLILFFILCFSLSSKAFSNCTKFTSPETCIKLLSTDSNYTFPRILNEVLLEHIRFAESRPTVVARNLYHFSALLWDIHASIESKQTVFHSASLPANINKNAVMLGAFTALLETRFKGVYSKNSNYLKTFMTDLQVKIITTSNHELNFSEGKSWAKSILEQLKDDGALESDSYVSYQNNLINPYLLDISQSGIRAPIENIVILINYFHSLGKKEYNNNTYTYYWPRNHLGKEIFDDISISHWIPLYVPPQDLKKINSIGHQLPLTLHWNQVATFSKLEKYKDEYGNLDASLLGIDKYFISFENQREDFIKEYADVIRKSQSLNPNDNKGNLIINGEKAADYYRSLAEFWADGPNSETPPGHWNSIANHVVDKVIKSNQPLLWKGKEKKRFQKKSFFSVCI